MKTRYYLVLLVALVALYFAVGTECGYSARPIERYYATSLNGLGNDIEVALVAESQSCSGVIAWDKTRTYHIRINESVIGTIKVNFDQFLANYNSTCSGCVYLR